MEIDWLDESGELTDEAIDWAITAQDNAPTDQPVAEYLASQLQQVPAAARSRVEELWVVGDRLWLR